MAVPLRKDERDLGRAPAVSVGALFDEFAPMVLAVCRYHLRDPQAAEDAAQDTFLSAHRSLLGGTRPRDPAAWLATIARNECRRAGRMDRPAPLDEERIGTFVDPADIVADRSRVSDVASAIAELPARQREALVLREFCGLSYEQVAAAMSVSGAAVDSLLSRARRRLVEQLGEIPSAAPGVLVVPPSLREELARLIPELGAAGTVAGAGAGAGAVAALTGLGSTPVAVKVAATCAATVALALPMQATVREEERSPGRELPRAATREAGSEQPADEPERRPPRASFTEASSTASFVGVASTDDRSGHGSGDSGSDSSGPGSGSSGSGSSGHGSGSSDSGSSGSGSSGHGSGSSGSGSSGSGSSGSDSDSSGHGSGSSGSDSSGSGSGGSGSSDDD